jgi:hypothetical protein
MEPPLEALFSANECRYSVCLRLHFTAVCAGAQVKTVTLGALIGCNY